VLVASLANAIAECSIQPGVNSADGLLVFPNELVVFLNELVVLLQELFMVRHHPVVLFQPLLVIHLGCDQRSRFHVALAPAMG